MLQKRMVAPWFLVVIVLVFTNNVNCGRFSSSKSSYRPSRPSPSPSHPSPSLSYKYKPPSTAPKPRPKPSPTSSWPSPSSSWPSPSSSWPSPSSSWPSPSIPSSATHRPIGFSPSGSSAQKHPSTNIGFPAPSPKVNPSNIGFKPEVLGPNYVGKTSTTKLGNANTGPSPPGIGFKTNSGTNTYGTGSNHPSGPAPQIGFKGSGVHPSAPQGPPIKPVGNVPKGVNQVTPPPYTPPGAKQFATQQHATQQHSNPQFNSAGYGQPPSYNPAGYGPPAHGYYPQQTYHPGGGYQVHAPTGSVTNIHINNINSNNYHSHGYGYGYGGSYFSSYPSYHYSSYDTGSGNLGFFLGYSLGRMTTPTYHYHSTGFFNGYTPRYDHYEVHHYYHNKESIPVQSTIQPNTIIGCIGDSGSICPSGTTSLCTNNGAVLCVASAQSTVPCSDQKQGNCVKTVIPCVNGTHCQADNETVSLPCISKAQVPGNITYVNNTIIVQNITIINNANTTLVNGTALSSSNNTLVNTTVLSYSNNQTLTNSSLSIANLTDSALNTLANLTSNSTTLPTTSSMLIASSDHAREKRDTPAQQMNEFCVTILALPAERKPTDKEKLVEKSVNIISKFFVRSLGLV